MLFSFTWLNPISFSEFWTHNACNRFEVAKLVNPDGQPFLSTLKYIYMAPGDVLYLGCKLQTVFARKVRKFKVKCQVLDIIGSWPYSTDMTWPCPLIFSGRRSDCTASLQVHTCNKSHCGEVPQWRLRWIPDAEHVDVWAWGRFFWPDGRVGSYETWLDLGQWRWASWLINEWANDWPMGDWFWQ